SNMRKLCLLLLAVSALLGVLTNSAADEPKPEKKKLTKDDIDAMMTALSNWGRWGAEDELGALNLITPDKRKAAAPLLHAAAALVQDGVTVSLARDVIKVQSDSSPPFVHRMVNLPKEGEVISSSGDQYAVAYHGFTITHMDGLCHLTYKGKMYNGFSQKHVT